MPEDGSTGVATRAPAAEAGREHLFISYATEDWAFAEWLALKLTAEGYKVWCDRFKLLGGESYPRDIDEAIKTQTFRFLAVLSRHSIAKPNPRKERTLALNVARARGEDFVVPLNLDGLRADEIDWMSSDLTFLSFHDSWAAGLRSVLKRLASLNAPRTQIDGPRVLSGWANAQDVVFDWPERLWSNVLPITAVPPHVLRVTATYPIAPRLNDWPFFRENDNVVWLLELPPNLPSDSEVHVERVDWRSNERAPGANPRHAVTYLLRAYGVRHCCVRGLRVADADHPDPYFPREIGNDGWISYTMASGRRSRIRVAGVRNFRRPTGSPDVVHHHLRLSLRPSLRLLETPSFFVHVGLHLTDAQGRTLPPAVALRRQRKIRNGWWNGAWLARTLACVEWLRTGEGDINLALTPNCDLRMASLVSAYAVPVSVDEARLAGEGTEDDEADLDDMPIDDDEDANLVAVEDA